MRTVSIWFSVTVGIVAGFTVGRVLDDTYSQMTFGLTAIVMAHLMEPKLDIARRWAGVRCKVREWRQARKIAKTLPRARTIKHK